MEMGREKKVEDLVGTEMMILVWRYGTDGIY